MKNHDVTILVCSCDKYEDAWHPFFELLHIYAGSELDCKFVLNTETKQYHSDHFNVRVVNTPNKTTWSKRMMNVMAQIDTEFVFLLLDDFFISAPFDHNRFNKVLDYMRSNPKVGIVNIAPRNISEKEAELMPDHTADIAIHDISEDSFFVRDKIKGQLNIGFAPTIWRSSFLLSLLREHEDIWSFERFVGMRACDTSMEIVRFLTPPPAIFEYDFYICRGMGITCGKWLPGNEAFFLRHGIEVDIHRLGVINAKTRHEISRLTNNQNNNLLAKILRRIKRIPSEIKSMK